MITQEEKETFKRQLSALVNTNFTGVEVATFVRDNDIAKHLLCQCDFCDYDKEISFIENNSDDEVKYVLDTPHMEYYDSLYGSLDPLMSFRIEKDEEMTMENLSQYDNVLSHMLWMLEQEVTEIKLDDILSRECLSKLLDKEYDCSVNQIYYFEPTGPGFYFAHYYRVEDSEWDCIEWDVNLCDEESFYKEFFEDYNDAKSAEIQFFSIFEYSYCEFLDDYRVNESLRSSVYNGENAINQLKSYATTQVRNLSKSYSKIHRLQEEQYRERSIELISECAQTLESFDSSPQKLLQNLESQNPFRLSEFMQKATKVLNDKDINMSILTHKNRLLTICMKYIKAKYQKKES